ncbi:MAG: hypothetical protein ACT4O4_01135 [Nitrospiraceae bacterium]
MSARYPAPQRGWLESYLPNLPDYRAIDLYRDDWHRKDPTLSDSPNGVYPRVGHGWIVDPGEKR